MPRRFLRMKSEGEKIASLALYDAALARAAHAAKVDFLLVGDSLGMVAQGRRDTLAVRARDIAYHTECVVRGAPEAFVIADMPFGTFQQSPPAAFACAVRFLAAGAAMVKIEGGELFAPTVAFLTARGAPVCAHIGLQPQRIRQLGGYAVQGRDGDAAQIIADAKAMAAAGAMLIVLELLPRDLAARITDELGIPTIGIGSGDGCDGQILVAADALGIDDGKKKRFVRDFLRETNGVQAAFARYVEAVKTRAFPAADNAFS